MDDTVRIDKTDKTDKAVKNELPVTAGGGEPKTHKQAPEKQGIPPAPVWKKWIWPLGKAVMATALRLLSPGVRVTGKENIPATGGVLLCPNHLCSADPPALAVALKRQPHFMIMEELFHKPFIGTLMRLAQCFPVNQHSFDRPALRYAENLLKEGEMVIIFPEGNGNYEGTLHPLFPGAMMVALRAKVPVIPVALINTNKVWAYGGAAPHRSSVPVEVHFGTPLFLDDLYEKKGATEEATKRLTETLAAMLHQPIPQGKPDARREPPAARQ